MMPLSRRQLQVLDAIRSFADRHRRSPSVRELAAALGRSCSTIHGHLRALEAKGLLTLDGSAHGMQLVRGAAPAASAPTAPPDLVEVPLLGTIAAGAPLDALEDQGEDPLLLSASLAPQGCYALRVRGDSMVDDHILDGDLVVVRPQDTVEQGTVAVALLDDDTATLKRIYRERDRIRLQPANSTMDPIFVRSVRIRGRVVAVVRSRF